MFWICADNELLEEFCLVWNHRCELLVCVRCHVGVVGKEAWAHCSTHESVGGMKRKDFEGRLRAAGVDMSGGDGQLRVPPGHDWHEAMKPVQGLLTLRGQMCLECGYCCKERKSLGTHFGEKHKSELIV